MNISTYIKRRRLTQAAILIKLTKKSLYHIAMDLNFSTQQALTRAFLREFNVTPLHFRNSDFFDYSRLLANWTVRLCDYSIKKTQTPSLKLNVKSFYFYIPLLSGSSTRVNKLRLLEVNNIISNNKDAVIVTCLEPNSKYEDLVRLNTRIGFKDEENYNFVTTGVTSWEVSFLGSWEDYVKFGRFFMLELEFYSSMYFIEIIQACRINENSYNVKIYLPAE
ncbi:hypothetical protein CB697_20255 [Salmonella enterica subsp. enterica serovar Chester]|nr:hypothetical protein [Salmonella enterica subsp. enterica serovar Chester]